MKVVLKQHQKTKPSVSFVSTFENLKDKRISYVDLENNWCLSSSFSTDAWTARSLRNPHSMVLFVNMSAIFLHHDIIISFYIMTSWYLSISWHHYIFLYYDIIIYFYIMTSSTCLLSFYIMMQDSSVPFR